MTLTEQVYAQAVLLTGTDGYSQALLQLLCQSAVSALKARMREGLEPEDCKAEFVTAASLYALAALSEGDEMKNMEQVRIGDVTMQRSTGGVAARCLRNQAERIMFPYLQDLTVLRRV